MVCAPARTRTARTPARTRAACATARALINSAATCQMGRNTRWRWEASCTSHLVYTPHTFWAPTSLPSCTPLYTLYSSAVLHAHLCSGTRTSALFLHRCTWAPLCTLCTLPSFGRHTARLPPARTSFSRLFSSDGGRQTFTAHVSLHTSPALRGTLTALLHRARRGLRLFCAPRTLMAQHILRAAI